jgi:hypothetical protein
MKNLIKFKNKKNISLFFCTCDASMQVKRIKLLWTFTTTLQTKPKQKFISNVLYMWPTHANEKNKTQIRFLKRIYNIKGLNMEREAHKLCNFFQRIVFQLGLICFQEHKFM